MKKRILVPYCIISFIVICIAVRVGIVEEEQMVADSFADSELTFAFSLNGYRRGDKLIAGYNYMLLKEFSKSLNSSSTIVNAFEGENYIDSLKRGRVDLVVLPFNDTLQLDSVSFSIPLDSLTMWAVRSSDTGSLAEVNQWLSEYEQMEEKPVNKKLFMRRYSPHRTAEAGRTLSQLSPYDDLIKEYAVRLGWDWRMLAAVIFQESRFHIEANSPRGARGLMQTMPSTAKRYEVSDLFDPEQSIKAGVSLLAQLQKIFQDQAANEEELLKFTLAAYNAGAGRIRDCINYASHKGSDADTWDEIEAIIPEMRDENNIQIDTVKHGVFLGHETIAYIDRVLSIYSSFCAICNN